MSSQNSSITRSLSEAWHAKRWFKQKVGYESETGQVIRDGLGCLMVVTVMVASILAMAVVVVARCPAYVDKEHEFEWRNNSDTL